MCPRNSTRVRAATAEVIRYEINECTTNHNRISASRDCRCSVCIFNTETNGNRQTLYAAVWWLDAPQLRPCPGVLPCDALECNVVDESTGLGRNCGDAFITRGR